MLSLDPDVPVESVQRPAARTRAESALAGSMTRARNYAVPKLPQRVEFAEARKYLPATL